MYADGQGTKTSRDSLAVTPLTNTLFVRLIILAQRPFLVLVAPNFHFTKIEATELLGTLKAIEMVL